MKIHFPNITGSAIAQNGFTGSLQGTASWANNATNALTASIALNALGSFVTSSWTGSASSIFAGTASFVTGAIFTNTNQALTASHALTIAQSGVAIVANANGIYSVSPLAAGVPNGTDNLRLGQGAGNLSTNTSNTVFLGYGAGSEATNASHTNFLGRLAGYQSPAANNSNFLGQGAGNQSTNANNSNFLGQDTGRLATNANNSNFFGTNAGRDATGANNSNFLGPDAGRSAPSANNSNFLGQYAGNLANGASYSNILGWASGRNATNASYSTLIGFQAGGAASTTLSIGTNNIIIGNAISLASQRRDSINIGGIIFGTGSYFNISTPLGGTFSGSANGRIGINQPLPIYSLDVSGSGNYTNGLIVTGSFTVITGSSVELQVLNTGVKIGNAPTDTHTVTGSLNVTGSTTQTGNNTLIGNTILSGSINISGSTTLSGSTDFYGTHTLSGSNTILGNTILSGSIDVSGSSNFHNSIFIVTGSTFIKGLTNISGSTNITGSFNVVDGDINVVSGSSFTRWGNKLFNYGQFSSTTTQSGSANTAYSMTFDTTDFSNGVTLVGGSRLTVANTGLYNIQFSAQLHTTANQAVDFSIWFAMTGSDIANSNTDFSIEKVTGGGFQVAALNFLTQIASGSYVELKYSKTTLEGQLQAKGTQSTPTRPATPSIIATVTQVA